MMIYDDVNNPRRYYDLASEKSFWRGYWYYKNGNVISFEKLSEYEYKGKVQSD